MKDVNNMYIGEQVIAEMNNFFANEGFLKLDDFLTFDIEDIKKKILDLEFEEVFEPTKIKCKRLILSKIFDHEILKFVEFFKTKDFVDFLEEITGFELTLKKFDILLFEKGDYSLLSDEIKRDEGIEVVFDMSDLFDEIMGSRTTYVTKEEEVFYLMPEFNSLTILYSPEELMKYVKYINSFAKNRKVLRIQAFFDIVDNE